MVWDGLTWTGVVLLAYFIGSVPTAYLVVRWLKGQDIRLLGDGNAGAANVSRIVGSRVGLGVGAIDVIKGIAAVLLAHWLADSTAVAMVSGVAAIAGHNWPVYLRGRGGRGAATAVGVLLAMFPLPAIPLASVGLTVLYLTRSTVKTVAAFFIPIPFLAAWPLGNSYPLIGYSLAIPLIVGASHYISLKRPRLPVPASSGEQAPKPECCPGGCV